MTDLFISYAREDSEAAAWVARRAHEVGYSVWWDRSMAPGADMYRVIEQQIIAARKVLVIWSRHSVASRWVRDEAELAAKQNKLIPICIDASEPPLGFRAYNIMYMQDWDNDFKRILHAMNPQAVKYTMIHVVQGGQSNPDQVKSLLRGLDAEVIAQTFSYLKERGYSQWLRSQPQRRALGQFLMATLRQMFARLSGAAARRRSVPPPRRTTIAAPRAPQNRTRVAPTPPGPQQRPRGPDQRR